MTFLKSVLVLMMTVSFLLMKYGRASKNGVTPAPTLDFTLDFTGRIDFNNPLETVADSVTIEDVPSSRLPVVNEQVLRSLKHKQIGTPSELVCKYGMAEIFLFGGTLDEDKIQSKNRLDFPKLEEDLPSEPLLDNGNQNLENMNGEESASSSKIATAEMVKKIKGDHHVNLEVSDMQSFEEWKNLKLQEQETRSAENEPIASHTVRAKKTQVNYASQDCGAKVLDHNKEAKHVFAILDENKDMYMLNPCSTSIWFVIELCEPIQVQQLQLGNLELFSSAPKEFSVSVSERFPAREWHSIGIFEASNERILQTFAPKSEGQMFAKYIKFDMLSHFSNEHFCPLTLIRVLGASMVDEFDEAEQMPSEKDSGSEALSRSQGSQDSEEDGEGNNGPINVVLNIVKTAIGLGNIVDAESENVLGFVKSNNGDDSLDHGDHESIDPTVESEVVLVTDEIEVSTGSKKNLTSEFITLVETGNGEDLPGYTRNFSNYSTERIPLYFPKFIQYLGPKLNVNICWFLEFFCKVSIASCLVHYPYNCATQSVFLPITNSIPSLADERVNNTKFVHLPREPSNAQNIAIRLVRENDSVDPSLQNMEINFTVISSDFQGDNKTKENASVKIPFSFDAYSTTNDEINREPLGTFSEKSAVVDAEDEQVTDGKNEFELKRVLADVRTVQDEGGSMPIRNDTGILADGMMATGIEISPSENLTLNASGKTDKSVANDSTVLETATDSRQPTVVSGGMNQKDSVLMRLSNRIRVLEQNMSLSSDYLENLSQRFKKQMDEMQRAFDQTTSKLLTTGRTAYENDARQTELIQQAQAEIQLLKLRVQNLSLSNDDIHMQLLERHMCLVILEIIIFTAVLVTCLGRRISQIQCEICKSEAMIENLKNFTQDITQNLSDANDKCGVCSQGYNRRWKRIPLQRKETLKSAFKQESNSSQQRNTHFTPQVEDIGKTAIDCQVQGKSSKEKHSSWSGSALSGKITNGHVKYRK